MGKSVMVSFYSTGLVNWCAGRLRIQANTSLLAIRAALDCLLCGSHMGSRKRIMAPTDSARLFHNDIPEMSHRLGSFFWATLPSNSDYARAKSLDERTARPRSRDHHRRCAATPGNARPSSSAVRAAPMTSARIRRPSQTGQRQSPAASTPSAGCNGMTRGSGERATTGRASRRRPIVDTCERGHVTAPRNLHEDRTP